MIMDDPGPAIFEADPADEFRISFTVPTVLDLTGRRTIMTMRCFEEGKLRGAIAWLGEHQDLWPEWRRIAEDEGGNALSAVLVDLAEKEALERFGSPGYLYEACLGAQATRGAERYETRLEMMLSTRSLPIINHAFHDERSRTAFMSAVVADDSVEGFVELAELCLLRGRTALARRMDEIARTHDVLGRRTGH